MSNEELTARDVRSLYRDWRRWSGNPAYKPSSRWDTCFTKLAALLQDKGWDPQRYMEAQFAACRPGFPSPNVLYNDKAQKIYLSYVEHDEPAEEAKRRFLYDSNYFNTRKEIGFDPRRVIENEGSCLSPLFRYVVGTMIGADVEKWKRSAVTQVIYNPAFKEVYGDLLPEELREISIGQ